MLVKVWNDNSHPYEEDFRGKKINIPAGKCVEMEEDQAMLFHGSFGKGPRRDVNGNFDPRSFKRIRLEVPVKKQEQLLQATPTEELSKIVDALVEKKMAEKMKEVSQSKAK